MTSPPSPLDGADVALSFRAQGDGLWHRVIRYYALTKPRVLAGNVLTTVAGFALASDGRPHLGNLLAVTVGTTLIIAAACVTNNILDRDIDKSMARTRRRVSVTGAISARAATVFAVVLGSSGLAVLLVLSSLLVAGIGVVGFYVYVVLYGMWSKRSSRHGTLVGSLSGALPVLAGYVAVTGAVDPTAVLAFAMIFFWQEPEFYSIAIYRRDEYAAAGVPVVSVTRGIPHTKRLILLYTALFSASALLLPVFSSVGITYLLVMSAVCATWLCLALVGLVTRDDAKWAKSNFRFSLWVVLVMCVMFAVGPVLP